MRVLVCGSRGWEDHQAIRDSVERLPPGTVVVHGNARGADLIAAHYAGAMGFEVEAHPVDWSRGRHAGLDRNIEMLDSGVDLVVAFQLNLSSGTQHTINEARRRGIALELHRASL
jgi:hypothetical protein